jgi:uroporphyrinogen-III synthase
VADSSHSPSASGPLSGVGVVVTRPARQAAGFAHKLATLGANPLIWPAIVILPPADTSALKRAHADLAHYDMAFFVSANAVEFGAPGRWPERLAVFVPGPGTAEALANVGYADARVPATTFDSEGLLALPALRDVAGKRVVIFRGESGRETLAEALRARGAHVDYVTCYRRAPPQTDPAGLIEAVAAGRAHALTLTSSEGVVNLLGAVGENGRLMLARVPAFVPHPRIAETARAAGLDPVLTAAGDAGLMAGLLEWFGMHPLAH